MVDIIRKIGEALKVHQAGAIALMMISDHSAFKAMATLMRNELTSKFGIKDVLYSKNGIKGDNIDCKSLEQHHSDFDEEYWSIVEKGLRGLDLSAELRKVTSSTKPVVDAVKKLPENSSARLQKIRSIMAHLFAYWTLERSEAYRHASKDIENKNAYLTQPHAAQLVAIFRLMGFDSASLFSKAAVFEIKNHLAQVLTGEGKSVTLAITAALFALLGFEVDCACYSEYLSARDYDEFSGLFIAFGVQSRIQYGTFNKLCEAYINIRGDTRYMVESLIGGTRVKKVRSNSKNTQRVLLIDEVDVFFGKDFYGSEYRYCVFDACCCCCDFFIFFFFLSDQIKNLWLQALLILLLPGHLPA